jgi:hypothetical protein
LAHGVRIYPEQVSEGASSLQRFAQKDHGMIVSKELTGALEMASRNKFNMREIWLDIIDKSRVGIAFMKPDENREEASDAVGEEAAAHCQDHKIGAGIPAQNAVEIAKLEFQRVNADL